MYKEKEKSVKKVTEIAKQKFNQKLWDIAEDPRETLFDFGKYKGFLIKDIAEIEDPLYVLWCIESIKGFKEHYDKLNIKLLATTKEELKEIRKIKENELRAEYGMKPRKSPKPKLSLIEMFKKEVDKGNITSLND